MNVLWDSLIIEGDDNSACEQVVEQLIRVEGWKGKELSLKPINHDYQEYESVTKIVA